MRYMLMCCFDESRWATLPEAEKAAIMKAYGEVLDGLVKSGHFRAGGRLHPTSTAATVRRKDGRLVVTDGPFAETKEQLGGYHLVECEGLDEAISIAARIPTLPAGGAIEVRPVEPTPER